MNSEINSFYLTLGSTTAEVVAADIRQVRTEALITTVSSIGYHQRDMDHAIRTVAGEHFHKQLAAERELHDLKTIIARGDGLTTEEPPLFRHVVFVVDDLECPFRMVVIAGLEAACAAGFQSVTIPEVRSGGSIGEAGSVRLELFREFQAAVRSFLARGTRRTGVQNIKLVLQSN